MKETVALYVRIPAELKHRLELGRLAGNAETPWLAPTMQAFLVALLEQQLPPLPAPPAPKVRKPKKAKKA